jgi:hypothetical protein
VRSLIALSCCLAVLAVSRPAVCAQAPRLKPGARIRFDAPSLDGQLTGTLVAWESGTLVVRVDGDASGLNVMVPVDSVTRIDVRRERRMTVEGLSLGALGGTLLALLASPDCADEYGESTALACLAYKVSPNLDTRVAVLGGVGALLGTMVGSETRKGTWAPVHLEGLNIGPASNGGIVLGVRISF